MRAPIRLRPSGWPRLIGAVALTVGLSSCGSVSTSASEDDAAGRSDGVVMGVGSGSSLGGVSASVAPFAARRGDCGPARKAKARSKAGFSPGFSLIDLPPSALRCDLRGMRAIGTSRVRVDLSWARVEPQPGTFDWRATDRVFRTAKQEGLKVLAVMGYEPAWARRVDAQGRLLPVDPAAFARFADRAARRYAPLVDSWEIWNEPNLERFWPSGPSPAAYAALVDAVAPVLQRRDRKATIIAGALAPAEDVASGSEISPVTFLKGYYASARRSRAVDAISVHPYSYPALPTGSQPWNTFRRLAQIREVMRVNGDQSKRIWLTEYGAPTGTHPRAESMARQGRMLAVGYREATKSRLLGPIFFYSYRDTRVAPTDPEANFGIVRKNGTRKLSYYYLARALRATNRKN